MQTTKHAIVHQIGLNCFLLKAGVISTVMQGSCTNSDIIMNKGKALRGKDIHGLQNTQKIKMTNVFEREDMHWHMINSSSSNEYISPK